MDSKQEIQKIYDLVIELGLLEEKQTRGVSEAEVKEVDKYSKSGRLPELYREFLLKMGGYIGGRYIGSYFHGYDDLAEMQTAGHNLLKQYKIEVPEDAFFFATHDFEVNFLYFRTTEKNDNPAVYMCGTGMQPFMAYKSFRDFLGDEFGEEGADELL